MIKIRQILFFTGVIVILAAQNCLAHFGMVIPSDTMVMPDDPRQVQVVLSFSHPFENIGMELVRPQAFFMMNHGRKTDLTPGLTAYKVMDKPAWKQVVPLKRPGCYTFVMEPVPYWEPAEDCYIIHYTKTVVAAFGDDEGWDQEIGLKTEIVPMTRPFGLYAGNLFQGVVKLNGKPVPHAVVEVESYNRDKTVKAPTEYMITQKVKADPNGVFSYCVPRSGWWGFAALNTSDKTLAHDGDPKEVELGAILWVKFETWQGK
jgi:cobalt/nickel transport protein